MIQCDWISAKIVSRFGLGYTSGEMIKLDPFGNQVGRSMAPMLVEAPSYSDKMRIFTPDEATLWLSGNPAKLFQGHNLWGSGDALGLFFDAGLWVRQCSGLFPSSSTYQANFQGLPTFSRVDLTRSYRFSTHKEAQEFIRFTAGNSRSRHGAARLYGSETAYFGQNSTRWTLKVYDKLTEFIKHGLRKLSQPTDCHGFTTARQASEWASGVVRFELTLRTPELEKLPKDFFYYASQTDLLELWQSYYDRITWTENAQMVNNSISLDNLPPKMLPVIGAWRTGMDLRACYPKNTFYRYRRQILEAVGVDICLPPPVVDDLPDEIKSALSPDRWDPEPASQIYTPPRENLEMYLAKYMPELNQKPKNSYSYVSDAIRSHIKH